MDRLEILELPLRAVTEPIDRIISCISQLSFALFRGKGYMRTLADLILDNPFLLISLSLVIIGFVIGILKRIISM